MAILEGWEAARASTRRVDVRFRHYRYDHTWGIEQRGEGRLSISRSGRWLYHVHPIRIGPSDVSRKTDDAGERYQLKGVHPERWHRTTEAIFKIDDAERTYAEAPAPLLPLMPRETSEREPSFSWSWPDLELFLLGRPRAELLSRFEVKLLAENEKEWTLELVPRPADQLEAYERARLILLRDGYRPRAWQLELWSGTVTQVWVALDFQTDNQEPAVPEDELFAPDLNGLRPPEVR